MLDAYPPDSVSINLSARCQAAKKEVKFRQPEYVGVHGYASVWVGGKQAMARNHLKIRAIYCVYI